MKRNHFLQVIILIVSILFSFASNAATNKDDVKTWVDSKGRLLIDTFSERNLSAKYQKLDELFLNYVDLDYIAKFVVGKYWKTMTPKQRDTYVPLFKRYSLSVYKSFPLNFENKISFEVTSAITHDTYTEVTASIDLGSTNPEKPQIFLVIFRLINSGSEYKIIDIKLAESSLILSYRNRFYEMIAGNDGDIDWFLEDLENITASTEKNNALKLKDAK